MMKATDTGTSDKLEPAMTKLPKTKKPWTPAEEGAWRQLEAQHRAEAERRRQMEQDQRAYLRKRFDAEEIALIERAWAAGFWDGEGNAALKIIEGKQKSRGEFNCSVDQEDIVNLERFQAAVGIGRITGPYRRISRKGKRQLIYRWSIGSRSDLQKLAAEIIHFLAPAKRSQFADAMSADLIASLADGGPPPDNCTQIEIQPKAPQQEEP